MSPEQPNAQGMLYLAILGIIINGVAMFRLKKGHPLNERAVALHLLEDVLAWVAVLIGSIVMMFVDVPILDPILSIAIAAYILFNIYKNLKDTLRIVLQGTPDNVDAHEIEHILTNIDGVKSIHDFHLWTMDGEYNIMTIHIVYDINSGKLGIAELKQKIREELPHHHNIHHAIIEIEVPGEYCGLENKCWGESGIKRIRLRLYLSRPYFSCGNSLWLIPVHK